MDYKKILRGIILVVLGLLLFYPPFLRGLFFKSEMYLTHIISFSLFIGFLIYKHLNKDYKIIKYPLEYALVILVVAYLIPIIFRQSASLKYSVEYLLRYLNYFLVYIIVRDMIDSKKQAILLLNIILASALGLCILGIDAAIGENIAKLISRILLIFGIKYNFFGGFVQGRIFSTYQYPNVLASCLGASYILTLCFMVYFKNKHLKSLYLSLGFIILSTFILTLSRGMYLVLPVAIVMYLALLKDKNKIIESILGIFINGIISIVFAMIFQRFYNTNGLVVWLALMGLFIVCYMFFMLIQKVSKRLLDIKNKTYYIVITTMTILLIGYLIIGMNWDKPLRLYVLNNRENVEATKEIGGILPNNKYIIKYNAKTKDTSARNLNYQVTIQGVNRFLETKNITTIDDTTGPMIKSLEFNTLDDTYSLRISFSLTKQDIDILDLEFSDLYLINTQNGKTKKVALDYLLLPNEFVSKVKDINLSTHNAWQRFVFMGDALKVIKDHGIFGLGGGAWRSVYYNYQSYDYSTTEVHSFPLQLWLEAGILGLISLVGLVGFIIYYFAKLSKENENYIFAVAIFTSIMLILGHSFIDFDFSLSAIVFMLYELIAIFSYFILEPHKTMKKNIKPKRLSFVCLALVVFISTTYVIPAYSAVSVSQRIKKYYETDQSIDLEKNGQDVVAFLEKEVAKDIFETKNREQLIRVYEQLSRLNILLAQNQSDTEKQREYIKKSQEYLIRAKENTNINLAYEPKSNEVLLNAAAFYINNGYNLQILNQQGKIDNGIKITDNYYFEQGIKFTEDANNMSKYQVQAYVQRARSYLAVGKYMLQQGTENKDNKLMSRGIDILNKIDEVKRDLISAGKTSLKPIGESKELDEIIGEKNQIIKP